MNINTEGLTVYIVDVLDPNYHKETKHNYITVHLEEAIAYAEAARDDLDRPSMVLTAVIDNSKVLFCPIKDDTPADAARKFSSQAIKAH